MCLFLSTCHDYIWHWIYERPTFISFINFFLYSFFAQCKFVDSDAKVITTAVNFVKLCLLKTTYIHLVTKKHMRWKLYLKTRLVRFAFAVALKNKCGLWQQNLLRFSPQKKGQFINMKWLKRQLSKISLFLIKNERKNIIMCFQLFPPCVSTTESYRPLSSVFIFYAKTDLLSDARPLNSMMCLDCAASRWLERCGAFNNF